MNDEPISDEKGGDLTRDMAMRIAAEMALFAQERLQGESKLTCAAVAIAALEMTLKCARAAAGLS